MNFMLGEKVGTPPPKKPEVFHKNYTVQKKKMI